MASVPASEAREMAVPDKDPERSVRAVGWRWQALMLLAAILIGLLGQFASFRLWIRPAHFAFAWIPGGILLALLILRPRREWPVWLAGVMAGGVAALMSRQAPLFLSACAYLANFAGMVLVANYLRRNGNRIFDTVPDFWRYFATAVLLVPAITGWTSAIVTHLAGFRSSFSLFDLWLTLAPNYAMGYLLIATPILALVDSCRPDAVRHWARVAEAVLIAIGLLLLSIGLWLLVPSSSAVLPLLLFSPVPLIMLAAMRFGSPGAAIALLLVSVPAAWLGVYGSGDFGFDGEQLNAHIVQLWLLAVGFLVHVLAIVSRQYESVRLMLTASHRHIRNLAGRLLKAQEEERSRLARELHDGVNQQIASLAIAVSAIKRDAGPQVQASLGHLHDSMLALSEDVRRISHNLHPGILDHVGLATAIGVLVKETGDHWDGEIVYDPDGLDTRPGSATTLCLYRIAQEALHNATTHSGARRIRVRLEREDGSHVMEIEDDGCGFDLETVRNSGSLGLSSMEERAILERGRFAIESAPGRGTRIWVRIPIHG